MDHKSLNKSLPKIAVIIPYYNGEDCIDTCIKSLLNNSLKVTSIYLVDNSTGFNSKPPQIAQRAPVVYIRTQNRIGYGRAANIGVYQAIQDGAEFVMVLNQDTKADTNLLSSLYSAAIASAEAVIGPIVYNYDLEEIESHFTEWYLSQNSVLANSASEEWNEKFYPVENYLSGACLFIPSKIVQRVGLFDPNFIMYGEDNDLSNRLLKNGIKIGLAPNAKLGHEHGLLSSEPEKKKQISKWQTRSRNLLYLKEKESFLESILLLLSKNTRQIASSIKHQKWSQIPTIIFTVFEVLLKAKQIRKNRGNLNLKKAIYFQMQKDR